MNVEWFWSSSILILLVVLIRFLFRGKIRPYVRYALWLIVAVRLLLPFSLAETAVSVLNLLPGHDVAETLQDDAEYRENPTEDFWTPEDMGQSEGPAAIANTMEAEPLVSYKDEKSNGLNESEPEKQQIGQVQFRQ